jgi:alpha-glucoside transport system substrate-binding protein
MMILTHRMVADGRTPWCVGFEHGSASGWVGSDWIEDILLRSGGPDLYDSWVVHEIPWTDPAVAAAWDRLGQIVLQDEYVLGGTSSVLTTTWTTAAAPLLETPPGCYMHRQGPWISDTFSEELLVGQDVDFFALPPIDSAYGTPMIAWASLLVMLHDTPQARDVLSYFAAPPAEAQGIWTARGWLLSPNQQVGPALEPDLYEVDLYRRLAEAVFAADLVRFDASDLMPVDVQQEFWQGAMEYVAGVELPVVLERIEERAAQVYP